MKEIRGDIFSKTILSFADAICITTNGFVKKDGVSVMGAGVAKSARDKYVGIDKELGALLGLNGNIVQIIKHTENNIPIIAFPTKHVWWEKSDLRLIEKSIDELISLTIFYNWKKIILPKPGCSNGGRSWLLEVKPILEKKLDDRFLVIDK